MNIDRKCPMDEKSILIWQTFKAEVLSKLGISDAQPEVNHFTVYGFGNQSYKISGTTSNGRKFFAKIVQLYNQEAKLKDCGFVQY